MITFRGELANSSQNLSNCLCEPFQKDISTHSKAKCPRRISYSFNRQKVLPCIKFLSICFFEDVECNFTHQSLQILYETLICTCVQLVVLTHRVVFDPITMLCVCSLHVMGLSTSKSNPTSLARPFFEHKKNKVACKSFL